VVWYTNQSLLLILLAFLLGLLVGYLWWGLRLRRVRSSESATESTTDAPVALAKSASAAAVADPEPLASPVDVPSPVDVASPSPVVEDSPSPAVEDSPSPVVAEERDPVDADLVADVESAFTAEPAPVVVSEEPQPHDKLERIEGIGPKIAAALRAAGITTYAALADADRSTVELALERANLRFAPSLATWSRQARLLADEDEAGFKELTDRLIAGREVSASPAVVSPVVVSPVVDEPVVDESVVDESVVDEPVVEEPVVAEPEVAEVEPEPEPEPVAEVVEEPAVEEPVVEPEPEVEPVAEVVEEPASEVVVVPAQAAAVEDVEPDNLRRIEGIGPKMSAALIGAGIKTYRQLAETDVDTLRAAIEAAGLRFAPSIVTWSRQAQHLADGDEEGFADLTRRLVAGRDTGRA
jgi:predicted flap endonuclease-1-like 5' DNA nuclease